MTPVTWAEVFRRAVAPVLAGYLVFLAIASAYRGERRERTARGALDAGRHLSWPFVRYLASTIVGGFGFFLLVVVVFYFVIGERSPTFMEQALRQGSLLTFAVVLPGFVILSLVETGLRRLRHRRRRRAPRE